VARWTHTASEFGAQYDSIADMVAFGAAPALIIYIWALQDFGKAGWIAAFVHLAGAGIRLARFNVNIGVVDKRFFQGLPSPSGAAVVMGLVWVMTDFGIDPQESPWLVGLAWLVAVFAGITMVLNVPFYSFKEFNWRRRVPLWVILAAVVAIALISQRPALVLYVIIMSYALSGYVMWAMGKRVQSVLPEE
jgi:CDP-diacylglycerol--serine O-phosphatidyltransferase